MIGEFPEWQRRAIARRVHERLKTGMALDAPWVADLARSEGLTFDVARHLVEVSRRVLLLHAERLGQTLDAVYRIRVPDQPKPEPAPPKVIAASDEGRATLTRAEVAPEIPPLQLDAAGIYARVVESLRSRGCFDGAGTKVTPTKAVGRCPLHRDRRPSLNITWNPSGVALFCHSCHKVPDILALLGMTIADLCATRWRGRQESRPVREIARYAYTDLHGTVLAEKVRFEGKDFRWCRPGSNGDIWNLKGVSIGLYRWPDLIDCPVVHIVEGEKSADQLWARGWPATCGPNGATKNGWWPALSRDAWVTGARTFIVFPDHDPAGAAHGELVARTTAALALELNEPVTIKVVQPFAGRPNKLNAVDWLLDGRTDEELEALIDATPVWTPDWVEQARRTRQRELTKLRMRNLRLKRRGGEPLWNGS